ncbi:hypothetical protein [Corynebacterium suicordis]|uniref:Secreted protein n=1 Tax=Corynebacterium suicordis DSM 45110 TaxID=1121369 RepID=A0ABR9ZM94_9CORY|nr:hypothetical protein [Corynebacterium suicordis]MBF4554384.1 hypothetical protein [Corynebacterium suicordis DSM 45110]MDR6278592.1 hypothetical protein [Corynebacterium suicordis]
MKRSTIIIASVVALFVLLGGLAWAAASLTSNEPEQPPAPASDADQRIDPASNDVFVAAEGVMAALLSMRPAEQESPYDQYATVQDRLSGRLLRVAQNPPTDDMSKKTWPEQWEDWARSGDRVQGFVTRAPGTEPAAEDATTAEVTVDMEQKVIHPDGDMTPYRSSVATVSMVKEEGVWKAENYQIRHVNF